MSKRPAGLPGLLVCLAFTAFAVASVGGGERVGYTATNASLHVVFGLLKFGTLHLSTDSLVGALVDDSCNGSSWSLHYEVMCYSAVGVVFAVGWLRQRGGLVVKAFVAAAAASVVVVSATDHGSLRNELVVVPFLLSGAVSLFYEDRIPLTGWEALLARLLLAAVGYGHRAESSGGLSVT